jgi:hypothetical protein
MLDLIRKYIDNIIFVLFVLFFILGMKNIIFMYISTVLLLISFIISDGRQGVIYILFLMGGGIFIAFIFDSFGNKGKYSIMIFGVLYIIFVLYKRYKSGKKLWFLEDEQS